MLNFVELVDNTSVYEVMEPSPLDFAKLLSQNDTNTNIWLKREDTLPVKSFKLRGAYNKISKLEKSDLKKGVIAVSAGNHAQGVAFTAKKLGIDATIIMPLTTPEIKINAVKSYGAKVIIHGESFSDTFDKCEEIQSKTNAVFIPPYDDLMIVAGQGTIGKEILAQNPDVETVVIPIGGGGLIAGVGTYIKSMNPNIKIIGVEAEDSACMKAAFEANDFVDLEHVGSFADGVAVKRAGNITFELAKKCVDELITVSTDQICEAIQDIYNESRTIVEPAGAISLAGINKLMSSNSDLVVNKNVVGINSGANMTFERLRFVTERTMLASAREALFSIKLPERSGALLELTQNVVKQHSITEFNYRKQDDSNAFIFIGISSKDSTDRDLFIKSLNSFGYEYKDMSHNEVAISHVRHMVGGKHPNEEEIWELRFPERPGALEDFLKSLQKECNITLFHYRYTGGDVARVLVGISNCKFEEIKLPKNFRATRVTDDTGVSDFL